MEAWIIKFDQITRVNNVLKIEKKPQNCHIVFSVHLRFYLSNSVSYNNFLRPDSILAEARDTFPLRGGQYSPKEKNPLKDKDHLLYNLFCFLEPFIVSFLLPNINRHQFSRNATNVDFSSSLY